MPSDDQGTRAPDSPSTEGALVRVLGTAELCKSWFDDHRMAFTAADLVALTRLVLEQRENVEMEASLDPDA